MYTLHYELNDMNVWADEYELMANELINLSSLQTNKEGTVKNVPISFYLHIHTNI